MSTDTLAILIGIVLAFQTIQAVIGAYFIYRSVKNDQALIAAVRLQSAPRRRGYRRSAVVTRMPAPARPDTDEALDADEVLADEV